MEDPGIQKEGPSSREAQQGAFKNAVGQALVKGDNLDVGGPIRKVLEIYRVLEADEARRERLTVTQESFSELLGSRKSLHWDAQRWLCSRLADRSAGSV